jgi:ribonuclease-3
MNLDFELLSQTKEEGGSPVFEYQAVIEGIKCGIGKGYSKKESQQLASKETLQRLRREPQFVEKLFEAKANRTKMEEMPVQTVPDVEEKDFIIAQQETAAEVIKEETIEKPKQTAEEHDEFDLSSITATPKPMTKEDIIAAAEEEAYKD